MTNLVYCGTCGCMQPQTKKLSGGHEVNSCTVCNTDNCTICLRECAMNNTYLIFQGLLDRAVRALVHGNAEKANNLFAAAWHERARV